MTFVPIAIALAAAGPDQERTPRCDLPCQIWAVNFGSLAAPGLGLGARAFTGPLPAGWSGGGAGAIVAIHAQVEGEHALAAITVVEGRSGSTCKPFPNQPFWPQCQDETIEALDFKLGYAFGERSWSPYIAVGPSYLTLTHRASGASAGFAVVGEGGVLLFRAQRWGRAALAATAHVPLFSSDYGSPAFTLVTLGLRLML